MSDNQLPPGSSGNYMVDTGFSGVGPSYRPTRAPNGPFYLTGKDHRCPVCGYGTWADGRRVSLLGSQVPVKHCPNCCEGTGKVDE